MASVSIFGRRFVYVAAGIAIAIAPAVAVVSNSNDIAPRVTAECQQTQAEDSFSMDCAPATVANSGDTLTEQEVAEPGFNAGATNAHGSGGKGGK